MSSTADPDAGRPQGPIAVNAASSSSSHAAGAVLALTNPLRAREGRLASKTGKTQVGADVHGVARGANGA